MRITIEMAETFDELLLAVAELGRVFDVQYPPTEGPLVDGYRVVVDAELPPTSLLGRLPRNPDDEEERTEARR